MPDRQRQQTLFIEPGFDIMHEGRGHKRSGCLVEFINERSLDDVMTTALGLLRESPRTGKALNPQFQHEQVFIHQRCDIERVGLLVIERHPVMAVLEPQCEPLIITPLIEHADFVINEVDQLVPGDRHFAAS